MIDAYKPKQSHREALTSKSALNITSRWHRVVEEYSRLALTFESDRLPALQGLAAQFQAYQSFRFLAGLWEHSLILDLLWDAESAKLRPEKRSMPTWSWASVASHASYPESDIVAGIKAVADVVHIASTWDGKRRKQYSEPGRITLLGYLAPVDHEPQEERDTRPSWRRHSVRARGWTEAIYVSSDFCWYDDGPEKLTDEDNLFLFWLASRCDHLYCLVLKSLSGSEGYFERIGITKSYQEGVELRAFKNVDADKKSRVHLI